MLSSPACYWSMRGSSPLVNFRAGNILWSREFSISLKTMSNLRGEVVVQCPAFKIGFTGDCVWLLVSKEPINLTCSQTMSSSIRLSLLCSCCDTRCGPCGKKTPIHCQSSPSLSINAHRIVSEMFRAHSRCLRLVFVSLEVKTWPRCSQLVGLIALDC